MLRTLAVLCLAICPFEAGAQTTMTYRYDALGRLVGSSVSSGGSTTATDIAYDAAGNRKAYKVSGASGSGGDDGSGAGVPAKRLFIVVPLNGFTVIPIG